MYPASHILRQALVDDSVADSSQSATWYCWLNYLPDEYSQNDTMSIYDTAGIQFQRTHSGDTLFYKGIQILFRGLNYSTVYSKAHATNVVISQIAWQAVTLGSDNYIIQTINQQSDIISLGKQDDSHGNWLFSCNYAMVIPNLECYIDVTSDDYITITSDGSIPIFLS